VLSDRKYVVGAFMLEYVHLVPGRLRIKLSELRNRQSAAEAEACIAGVPGVIGVAANPATGSLRINFDKQLSVDDLWERLRTAGCVSSRCPEPSAIGHSWIDGAGAQRFGRAVMAALLDTVVQHSAKALVRALL
jgi:Heavy metal associated domain 2